MANFRELTRYTNGNITTDRNGKEFLVLRKPLVLEPAEDDKVVIITDRYIKRPDLLADVALGDRRLWWVIFEFNNIKDPFFELKLGQIIRIPSKKRVLEAIKTLNRV